MKNINDNDHTYITIIMLLLKLLFDSKDSDRARLNKIWNYKSWQYASYPFFGT